ncbi:MAG: ribonuclease III [Coriobacteriales bacterium]|nr:ribonuclease III [Coriobacteriales bacterium]
MSCDPASPPISQSVPDERRCELAEKILGYRFKDRSLLYRALTHPSAVLGEESDESYERLEFLGDAVLGMIISRLVYDRFPHLDEGGMTRIKVALVSGQRLSAIAEELGFSKLIVFGSSEKGTGNRGLVSALEDIYEALVAALTLDGGIDVATAWIERSLGDYISPDLADEPSSPKSLLQETLQMQHVTPTYEVVRTEGPPHRRMFTVNVLASGAVIGQGKGHSKKDAEAAAAAEALKDLTADS